MDWPRSRSKKMSAPPINRYHQRVTESMRRRTRGMVVTIPLRNGKGDHVGFAYRDWPDAKGWFKGTNAVWRDDCPDEDRLPRALLGIDRAREAIAGSGRAVVVRRIEDLIAMHEAGLSQAVVIVGSVPGVDRGPSDLAGHESLAWLHSAGARDIVFVGPDMRPTNWGLRLRPFHVELPEGTGVAEFLRDHGAIELRRLIDGAEQCQLPMFA